MQDREKKLAELYEAVAGSANAPAPKRGLFGIKCPKCGGKLSKQTEKQLIVVAEGISEFSNKVMKDLQLEPGAYDFTIEQFSCGCGYRYAKASADAISE